MKTCLGIVKWLFKHHPKKT